MIEVPHIAHVVWHGDVDFGGTGERATGGIKEGLRDAGLHPAKAAYATGLLPGTAGVEAAADIRFPNAGPLAHGSCGGVGGIELGNHDEIPVVVMVAFHEGGGNSDGGFFADAAGATIISELQGDGGLGIRGRKGRLVTTTGKLPGKL